MTAFAIFGEGIGYIELNNKDGIRDARDKFLLFFVEPVTLDPCGCHWSMSIRHGYASRKGSEFDGRANLSLPATIGNMLQASRSKILPSLTIFLMHQVLTRASK